jgi:hypothetical protein
MAINKLISIKQAILEASEDMGFDITRDKPTFAMWAVRAEKDIGSYYSYKRQRAVLTITGCCAELPSGAAYLKAAVLGDHGCDCEALFTNLYTWASSSAISASETFLIIDRPDTDSFCLGGSSYSIQDNAILFANNLDGQKVTIEYLGLQEDCDGFVMVNENHIPAIIEYIMWKFCIRSRFSNLKMELGDTKMHQQEYFRLASDSRAMDAQLTESERAEIVSLLTDPFSGYGLNLGESANNGIW